MERKNLSLYTIKPKYIQELLNSDKRVYYKTGRPFIGVVVVCSGQKYCIPLTSAKERFSKMKGRIDFGLIKDGDKIIAGIEYSRMIPVEEYLIRPVDINERRHDSDRRREFKKIRRYESDWCESHSEEIINKANVLYNAYISGEPFKRKEGCLNFPQLEEVCRNYCRNHLRQHKPR